MITYFKETINVVPAFEKTIYEKTNRQNKVKTFVNDFKSIIDNKLRISKWVKLASLFAD